MEKTKANKSNWIKIICLAIMAVTFCPASIAQDQATDNHEWKLIKKKRNKKKVEGWSLYKRKVSGSKLHEFKVVGKVNSSMKTAQGTAMEMFTDSSLYFSRKGKPTGTFKILEQTENELTLYSYMYGRAFVKDRDVVVRYSLYEDLMGKAMGVKWHQVDVAGYEATDKVVRMPVDIGDWRFKEIDHNSCMASGTFRFHPGGNPPAWMINMMAKWVIPSEIVHLREFVKSKP
ncbi:hypothetical protein [Spongiimicrobium sp. 3-5]|uniref:hypothetical protein n=1 Tax=Spongiimicrobium sp. 3-5 TaxID=3332596 RepID=UPI0039814D0F